MRRRIPRSKLSTGRAPQRVSRKFARWAARYNVNRYLQAYQYDGDPGHLQNAWLALQAMPRAAADAPKLKVQLDGMLADLLRRPKPPRGGGRPRKDTVRDLKIWRHVGAFLASNPDRKKDGLPALTLDDIFETLARDKKITKEQVKEIYYGIERAFHDPYYRPRAYRKSRE